MQQYVGHRRHTDSGKPFAWRVYWFTAWRELPGGHSRVSILYGAFQSLFSVARRGDDAWRGAPYDAPYPLVSVAGGDVANSVARRNVIHTSDPSGGELEHKTRQEFRPMRER